ncbi:MAG TPA: cellulase family glycosylhydrolase [Gaiellaceae bacterium]|jgi:aryl-phospho-beta-D-glucosidase BglC (GH1 family)
MPLRSCLIAGCLLVTGIAATSASAADHMWMGFQDDPALRWRPGRSATFHRVQRFNVSVVRTTVYWSRMAPRRPKRAANPFDRAYRFADLDEFVRNAETRGIAVMLTIWGTPRWANSGKGANVAPKRPKDLTNFARAVADRYNGTHRGLPAVQFYGVWNEPNLGLFLTPQYNRKGKPISPRIYARLYRAAYAGIKAGNPEALVGIGETSPRGRDAPLGRAGKQETLAPQTFARLLARARPRVHFDAWSHHPYSNLGAGPRQRVHYPNANLPMLPLFEEHLNNWFRRKSTPIWITEYGFQTKPGEPKGVTPGRQAAYLRTAVAMARRMPYVQMFVWFIFRDDPSSTWQSGVLYRNGRRKPAAKVFPNLAAGVDGRNRVVTVRSGTRRPVVKVPAFEFAARGGPRAKVYSNVKAYVGGKLIAGSQPHPVAARASGYVRIRTPIPRVVRNNEYVVSFELSDSHGNRIYRYVTIGGA